MSRDKMEIHVLQYTCKALIVELGRPGFGQAVVELEVSYKDNHLMDKIVDDNFKPLSDKTFSSLCPGLMFCPKDATRKVSQVQTDSVGNKTCLPTQEFMTVLWHACDCLPGDNYLFDIVDYAYHNLEKPIKAVTKGVIQELD